MIEILLAQRSASKYVQLVVDHGAGVIGHARRNKSLLRLDLVPHATDEIEHVQAVEVRLVRVKSAEEVHFVADHRGAMTCAGFGGRGFQVESAPVTTVVLLNSVWVPRWGNKIDKMLYLRYIVKFERDVFLFDSAFNGK